MQVNIEIYRRLSPMKTKIEQAIEIFEKNNGILKTHECMKLGIHPRTLHQIKHRVVMDLKKQFEGL